MNKLSDEWQTPQWLFDELNKEFNFDIDLCARYENRKCDYWSEDYLNDVITNCEGEPDRELSILTEQPITCFMNPPYSNPRPFIEKAWEDSKYCKIVCLVKCDPSTKWWATFWDYNTVYEINESVGYFTNRGPKPGCEVRFFPKRIKFTPPVSLGSYCTCTETHGTGYYIDHERACKSCRKKLLSGPTFPSALLIFDRRH